MTSAKSWHKIGQLTDIPRLGARCVLTPFGRLAVFRTADDEVYAIEDRCPHKGGPLSQGIVHDTSVTCPLHNMVISLKSGKVLGPDEGAVRAFSVRIDPDTSVIELSLAEVTHEAPYPVAAE